jgi:phenylacetate-coenzyme A ligase PaaK-like adenylate-forming protein
MTAQTVTKDARPCRLGKNDRTTRLRELLALHFHPEHGSEYWLRRQEQLGWDVRDRLRTFDDLWRLGPTWLGDLRRYSVWAFIPRVFHRQAPRFVVGETAGTSGSPVVTAYREDEFQAAFITPFLRVASTTRFPHGESWLWVGPSGPHLIGKVVRELARQTRSMDPFSVDFDPRWAKKLVDGSMGRQRYLDHVTSQALEVLRREEVGVLFITPPALKALTERLSDREREAIHGIHYGGMRLTPEAINHFRAAFPSAVHLAGYGNTLFGVVMEMADRPRQNIDYFPLDERLHFQVVEWLDDEETSPTWPPAQKERGQFGRLLFHRLDESCLMLNVLERDETARIAPSTEARALGGIADGLRDPRPPANLRERLQQGLY